MIMNKIITEIVLGIGVFMMSCHSVQTDSRQSERLTRFDDIDLYTLTGIGKVEMGKYPFINIDSMDQNTKGIILHYSKDNQVSDTFKRNYFGWFRTYTTSIDTAMATVVELIDSGKIIWLEYVGGDTSLMKMCNVRIFNKDKLFAYSLKDPLKSRVGVLDSSVLEMPMNNIIEEDYSVMDGCLRKISVNHNFVYKEVMRDTTCYDLGAHSISWWILFGDLTRSSKCKCH